MTHSCCSRFPCLCIAGTLLGPLHTKGAIKEYTDGLAEIKKQGGRVLFGGNVVDGEGFYVQPTIVEIDPAAPIVKTELFVPILYVMKFKVRGRARMRGVAMCCTVHVLGAVLVGKHLATAHPSRLPTPKRTRADTHTLAHTACV